MIDGQEHRYRGVASMNSLEVLSVIARFMIYLAVPYIEVTSINLKTSRYRMIYREVKCSNRIAVGNG